MVAILRLGRSQVEGEIVRIMAGICCEDRRNFEDQRMDMHKKLCTVLVDLYLV